MTRAQKGRAKQGPGPAPPSGPPTKHRGRLRIFIGLAVVIAAFTAFVTPGFAEFESLEKGDTGKGEIFEAILTEGPSTVTCESEEGASDATWIVENEGKEERKSRNLLMNIEKLGKCTFVAAAGQEGEAKISGCELETTETGEQIKVPISIVKKTCVVTVGQCEISLAPGNNKELHTFEIQGEGETDANTGVSLYASKMTSTVNSECGAFGIQASKNITLTALGEFDQVKSAAPPLHFVSTKPDQQTESAMEPHVFTFHNGSKVTCEETQYKIKPPMSSQSLAVRPVFAGAGKKCKLNNNSTETVTVTPNSCEFIFEDLKPYSVNNVFTQNRRGQLAIDPSNCEVKISYPGMGSGTCERIIKGQVINPGFYAINSGSKLLLKVERNAMTLAVKVTYKVANNECTGEPTSGNPYKDGTYKGMATLGSINVS